MTNFRSSIAPKLKGGFNKKTPEAQSEVLQASRSQLFDVAVSPVEAAGNGLVVSEPQDSQAVAATPPSHAPDKAAASTQKGRKKVVEQDVKSHPFSLRLPPETVAIIKDIALKERRSFSAMVKLLLDDGVEAWMAKKTKGGR